MNTNKKNIIFFIIFLLLFGTCLVVNAAPLKHAYVGHGFCDETAVLKVLKLVGIIVIIAKIAIPLILIALGSLDLYKGVVGKDEKDLTNAFKTFVFRLIAGVLVFFIPTFVEVAFDLAYEVVGGSTTNRCIECVLDTSKC